MKQIYQDRPQAVVLGLGQNGLATVRSLARKAVPVIGIDRNLDQYTARTRYCKKLPCSDFKQGDGLVNMLKTLGSSLSKKAVLFPSGDFSLDLLSERRDELSQHYVFTFPEKDVVRLCLDKKKFYQFAQKNNFPIPQTFFPKYEDDWRCISKEIRYPCIVKPFQPHLGWRKLFPDQKLFEADGEKSLLQLHGKLAQSYADLVVQERIPGGDRQLSFSLTYFDSNSKPLGMFTGRKLRQYPPKFGTSSMAQSHWDQRIADKTIELLTAMNYTGYGSVEFMWDNRDRKFKIIEVSARTWFPHGISSACGLNLEYIAYCDKVNLPIPHSNGIVDGVKWIHEERDLRSSLFYLKNKEMNVKQWYNSYLGERVYAIAAWDDPMPFLRLLVNLMKATVKSLLDLGKGLC